MDQLILDFQRGNSEAYRELFHLFYQPLFLFLSKMGMDSFITEEIIHDTFLKLWNKSADFSEMSGLRSFLYVSCKNAALNVLDKKRRLREKEEGYSLVQDWVEMPVTQQIVYSETIQAIHAAIQRLPDQCQKVMRGLFVDGMTAQEVAIALRISDSTVYNQKMRGVKLLRDILDKNQFYIFMLFVTDVAYFSLK